MIKKLLAIGSLAIAFPAQAAVLINWQPGVAPPPPGLTVIEDFEGYSEGGLLAGASNAFAYSSSSPNGALPPFNGSGKFGSVLGGGSYSLSFAPTSIFSFVIGSLDSYNKVTLTFASGLPQILTGAQIALGATANGNQSLASSNGRVTYTITGATPLLTGIKFESDQNSMELDNLAIGAVPEPATWFMMLMGFAAVGFSMRRKRNLRPSFA